MGGVPYVLAEEHDWLRHMVTGVLRDPVQFWEKLDSLPTLRGRVPKSARRAIERMLPEPGLDYRIVHRIAGLGSLGRERYVAIATLPWRASGARSQGPGAFGVRVGRRREAFRTHPLSGGAGQIGPRHRSFCSLARKLDRPPSGARLLARGAGFHAQGTRRIQAAARHGIRNRQRASGNSARGQSDSAPSWQTPADWLHQAATAMVKATTADWREWRASMRRKAGCESVQ